MKKKIQQKIRNFHINFFLKDLPDFISIYLHSIDSHYIDKFLEMINFFKENNYEFVLPDKFIYSGNKKILLSFDDNLKSWNTVVNLLEKCSITATFFVNTWCYDNCIKRIPEYYDKNKIMPLEINDLICFHNSGHCIAGHTHSHLILTDLDFEHACKEIHSNKIMLEKLLNDEINNFSYPYGMRRHFNKNLEKYCYEIGYKKIFSAIGGLQHSRSDRIIHRTYWRLDKDLMYNIHNLKINGRLYEMLTGRSAVG